MAVYEAFYKTCPYCGYYTEPTARSAPEYVDGDLTEMDPAALAALRGERVDVDLDPVTIRAKWGSENKSPAAVGAANRFAEKQAAQRKLRESIAWWGAYQRHAGRPDSESYRRFYYKFGVDVESAQALGRREADELAVKINEELQRASIL